MPLFLKWETDAEHDCKQNKWFWFMHMSVHICAMESWHLTDVLVWLTEGALVRGGIHGTRKAVHYKPN